MPRLRHTLRWPTIDRMARFPFSPFPIGWYGVAFSDELAPGVIETRRLFGKELVLYRTHGGRAVLADAFCPHLGAHLGHGGLVDGEALRCPMHGFCFDPSGHCVSTPYGHKAPPTAQLGTFPVHEQHGLVLAFYHPHGATPTWFVPDLDTRGWSSGRRALYRLRSHPQETTENSADLGHFAAVHGYSAPTLESGPDLDGPHLSMRYTFTRRAGTLRFLARELAARFTAYAHGLGYSLVHARVEALGIQTRHIVLATPTDGEHIELRTETRVGPALGGPPARLPQAAWRFVAEGLSYFTAREFCLDLQQDFRIWENKAFIERPPLARGDGPVPAYRRWCRQFYEPTAPGSLPVVHARA